jgi:hypothetical protein
LFYDILFRYEFIKKTKENKPDEENLISMHNQEGENIRGTELKTLYEKFCYFNGYLERKLDDSENLKLLEEKGFMLE